MTDREFTEAEIMKALLFHFDEDKNCEDCPYVDRDEYCHILLGRDLKSILDLINRKNAENERLTINMNAFGLGLKREAERAASARAEAIKEFAERVTVEKLKQWFLEIYKADKAPLVFYFTDDEAEYCARKIRAQIAKEMGVE